MSRQKIPGNLPLAQTAERIHQVELGGFVMVGCEVIDTFNVIEFAYANLPTRLLLLPAAATPPTNATIFWSGHMLVAGQPTKVRAYRAQAGTSQLLASAPLQPAMVRSLPEPTQPAETRLKTSDSEPGVSILLRETVVARALSAVDTATEYALEKKIQPKRTAEYWPEAGMRTDCSSFVAWCLRMSAKVNHPLYVKVNGGWLETTAVYQDGLHKTGYFSEVEHARPGSLLVFGDHAGKHGHMGIVVESDGPGIGGVRSVVHCSSGNFKQHGRAIRQTDAAIWISNPRSIIVDYEGFS